jgi:hypothetical protein
VAIGTQGYQVRLGIYLSLVLRERLDVVDLDVAVRVVLAIGLVEIEAADCASRNASKGGRSGGRGRPARSGAEGVRDIKDLLKSLTDDVLSGEVERATTIAANQLLNTALRAIELERKWKELGEIEERLSALEGARQGVSRWG